MWCLRCIPKPHCPIDSEHAEKSVGSPKLQMDYAVVMKFKVILVFVFIFVVHFCSAQLVRRVDYDAAIAVQAGGSTGILLPGKIDGVKFDGIYGLKMTFPFTRRWFLGAEFNYNQLRTQNKHRFSSSGGEDIYQGDAEADLKMQALNIPVYVKYLFGPYGSRILCGGYFSWIYKGRLVVYEKEKYVQADTDKWDAGIVIGIEQRIIKHLNLMFKINTSVKDLLKEADLYPRKMFPVQANLTLSYDIFRVGDCGCD